MRGEHPKLDKAADEATILLGVKPSIALGKDVAGGIQIQTPSDPKIVLDAALVDDSHIDRVRRLPT